MCSFLCKFFFIGQCVKHILRDSEKNPCCIIIKEHDSEKNPCCIIIKEHKLLLDLLGVLTIFSSKSQLFHSSFKHAIS